MFCRIINVFSIIYAKTQIYNKSFGNGENVTWALYFDINSMAAMEHVAVMYQTSSFNYNNARLKPNRPVVISNKVNI